MIKFILACLVVAYIPYLAGILVCLWILNKINPKHDDNQQHSNLIDLYFHGSRSAFYMFVFVALLSFAMPWTIVFLFPFVWYSRKNLGL